MYSKCDKIRREVMTVNLYVYIALGATLLAAAAAIAIRAGRRRPTEPVRHTGRYKAYDGVYLTEEQIDRLEQGIELPAADTPVFLKNGEKAVYYSRAALQDTKSRGADGEPECCEGRLVLTTRRLVFLSDRKGFEISYPSITAATEYFDGLSVQSRSRVYTLLLPKADLAVKAFDSVRAGDLPVASGDEGGLELEDDEGAFVPVTVTDGMDGHEFEQFCAELLRKNGFSKAEVTPGSGDQGVDILAEKDGVKYAVQCKSYSSQLGNTPVQEINAGKVYYGCHVGAVMTNSTFTQGAVSLAEATGVLLWDRDRLSEMMKNL